MKAPPRAAPVRAREAFTSPIIGNEARQWMVWAVGAGVVALIIMGFYLWGYPARGITVPMGWDTARYIWRTGLAQKFGLAHLQQHVQSTVNADNSRPAFPALAGMLSSLGGLSLFRLAAVIPIATASALGLAAGAFIGATLRRPPWEMAVVALGVGTSSLITRLLGPEGYQDNLMAGAVFLAAAIPLAMSLHDRRAVIPGLILFGMGGLIHWAFFVYVAGAVLVTAILYLPASWRRWRRGEVALWDTPAARLTEVVGGAAGAAAIGIFGILGGVTRSPAVSRGEYLKKLRHDLPLYHFRILIPAASLGAASLAVPARRSPERPAARERTRFVLALLVSWCAITLAGYLAFHVLHLMVPAHRFLAFALALPILAMLAVVWVGRQAARVGGVVAAAIVAVGLLVYPAYLSHHQWFTTPSWIDSEKVHEAATVAAYLDATHVAPGRPVVFILQSNDWNYTVLMGHMIRSALPADRTQDVYLYIGTPQDYLADRPTASSRAISAHYFQQMKGTYARNPVAVVTGAFNDTYFGPWKASHPGSLLDPQIGVVRGPPPPAAFADTPSPVGPYRSVELGALAVMSLAVFWVVGLGWSLALLRPWLRDVDLLAVAPAVGIGALVAGGVLLDRVGLRLQGATGVIALVAVLVAGWALFAVRARRPSASGEALAKITPAT